jgi:hypothetical protein
MFLERKSGTYFEKGSGKGGSTKELIYDLKNDHICLKFMKK